MGINIVFLVAILGLVAFLTITRRDAPPLQSYKGSDY